MLLEAFLLALGRKAFSTAVSASHRFHGASQLQRFAASHELTAYFEQFQLLEMNTRVPLIGLEQLPNGCIPV